MSPLIHRSLTWSIVGAVVLMSTWLAGNVQVAHERRGLLLGASSGASSAATSLRPAMPAAPRVAAVPAKPEAPGQVQLTAKR
ncbi:hypothetical protein SAMN05216359_103261 [Roseateles sp. YR242]|uniref:hypothetical protein n=1 Tax=Roseateles sp. YR242 TaxID=1855305 RepID=UPI0008CEFEB5|nr:hypothetical protein [Roseateles sp. YR242]SEK83334.1 hypothetical protein SAMN05216359_103261 [Roseateles sp. YR242]